MKKIYGRHPVLESLAAGSGLVQRVILAKEVCQDKVITEIHRRAVCEGISVETADRRRLTYLAGTSKHQGVLAEIKPVVSKDISDIFQVARMRREDPFILLLDGIEDPHNFGSILRSAEGFGVHGVIIGERRQVALTPVVWKTSAGAAAYVPVVEVTNLARTVDLLRDKYGLMCVGLAGEGTTSCREFDFSQGLLLVVGGEGKGIRPVIRKRCDALLQIPLKGRVRSYNVSVASAVVLFEVMCQRDEKSGTKK